MHQDPHSENQPGSVFHPAGGSPKAAEPIGIKQSEPPPTLPSPSSTPSLSPSQPQQPIAVVNTYTPRGVEYMIMFFALWTAATSLGTLLHAIVDNMAPKAETSYFSAADSVLPLSSIALGVGVAIFVLMFLRLKKAELHDPSIRLDSSRRRAVYLTVLVTFLIGLQKIITYIYGLFNGGGSNEGIGGIIFGGYFGGGSATDPGSPLYLWDLLHLAITLGIAGAIFVYYWRDMHKDDDR